MSEKNPKIDHAKIGQAVEQMFLVDYIEFLGSTKRQINGAIVRGFFTGLAGVVGATLGVAILLAILQLLGGAPFVGHYIQDLANSISPNK